MSDEFAMRVGKKKEEEEEEEEEEEPQSAQRENKIRGRRARCVDCMNNKEHERKN